MVYFWTYVHPLYCSSDLQACGFNSCGRSMHCRSNGYVKNSIFVRPTYFQLSLGQVIRSDGPFLQVGWALFVIGRMCIFRRSDGHFSQVGWTLFVGRMCIFRRSDGQFSQVGWALFVGNLDGHFLQRSAKTCGCSARPPQPCPSCCSARPRNELNLT